MSTMFVDEEILGIRMEDDEETSPAVDEVDDEELDGDDLGDDLGDDDEEE